MRLSDLAHSIGAPMYGADVEIGGIAADSRAVRPGDLFVAVRGDRVDGADFIADARARGAAALCATAPTPTLPTIAVRHPRAALAKLSAAFYAYPARAMRLIGVTGTLGKTSTALLLRAALDGGGSTVGVIGSLGASAGDAVVETGMTTPDAPTLHRALGAMRDAGVRTAVIEVTSHALAQHRVDGLSFALGVLTNLVPDEHLEFHPTAEDYLRVKSRFFDLLARDAPLVVNDDDALVRDRVWRAVRRVKRPVVRVSLRGAPRASVTVRDLRSDLGGATFTLDVVRELPRLDGAVVEPCAVPLVLPVFGVQQVENAALAAAAALVAGASPAQVTEAVAGVAPMRRRMEIVRSAAPLIIDDTVGNPRSLRAVFESIRPLLHGRRLHVAFGIRGSRGTIINQHLAHTLARLVRESSARASAGGRTRLVVTASEDSAGPRDRVHPEERDRVVNVLARSGVAFEYEPTLEGALRLTLRDCEPDDLVLLLGAQGMDRAAGIASQLLDAARARTGSR